MNNVFVMYVPGSELSEFHNRSPWIMIPASFKEIGYQSALICGAYSLSSTYGIKIYPTIVRKKNILKSLIEPFFGFKYITSLKPDILLISPIGSYIFTIIPLIYVYKIYTKITRSKQTKFILKSDWSLDFTNIKWCKRMLSILLLVLSSYTFDIISFETYCGVSRAKGITAIKTKVLRRIPIGYPQNTYFGKSEENDVIEKRIVCVARIAEMKGQIVLLKSFLKLSHKYPNWQLRFIGPVEDIDYKRQLESLILKSNLKERVLFTEFLEEGKLLEELRRGSILCLPSIHTESAGQVKYEAIAAGLPVVTTDIPCREDNEELCCLVAKAGDVDDLAKNLELLMSNPQLRKEIVNCSKKKALSYRDIAILYRDLLMY